MDIPKEYLDKISLISSRIGVSEKELISELQGIYKETIKMFPDLKEDKRFKKSWDRFVGSITREYSIHSPAIFYTGQIWGDSGIIDLIEMMKRKAEYIYKTDRDRAIRMSLTTSTGIPLDTREKINYGRDDNPNYLRPFKDGERSLLRSIYGVCCKGSEIVENELRFFRLNLSGDNIENIEVPNIGEFVQFRANPKKNQKYGFLDLNAMSNVDNVFVKTNDKRFENIKDVLNEGQWKVYSLSDLEALYSYYGNDKSIPLLIEASVVSIGLESDDRTRNRTIWLIEPELIFDTPSVPCYIPSDIPLNFGLDSRVIFVGRVDKFSDEDSKYFIASNGYYVVD